jgi:chorismate dehydratase
MIRRLAQTPYKPFTLKSLRIGCVKYLNARPLIRGWPGDVDFDHPSALCNKLARGDLDIALASSFEFLRNPEYRVVDDVSISSAGPVYSVVVVHRGEISEIEEIELDPASETSVNLLRCLLAALRLKPRLIRNIDLQSVRQTGLQPAESQTAENISAGRTGKMPMFRGRLLIGDQAIRFRQRHAGEFHFWDLGEQWNKLVGLPFLYALWLIRPEVRDSKPIADRLRRLRDENLVNIDKLVAEEREFDHGFCRRYYWENLRFSFGEEEKQGLTEFHKRCVNLQLLPDGRLGFEAWDLELARCCV